MRIIAILFVLSIIYGCDSSVHEYKNTFKYNQSSGISSLDPAFSREMSTMWACSHVYESLFALNQKAELEPILIDSYEIDSEGKEYIFHLKKEIYFHANPCFRTLKNTRELEAKDVIYSLSRLIDASTASPGAWVLKNKVDSLDPFQLIDKYTVRIRLRKPNAQLLYVLSMPYCSIIPEEAVEYYGKDFRKNPVGTGPFQFKLWDEGTALFFEKNLSYHQRDSEGLPLPYLDYIKISFNEQKKTEFLSFARGELSFMTSPDQSSIQDVFDPKGQLNERWKHKIQCLKQPFLNTEYMAIMQDSSLLARNSPLKNRSIRRAINLAINRREIVQYIKSDLVSPADKGFVAAGMPNYDTFFRGYEYHPEESVRLIHSAGYSASYRPKLDLHTNNSLIELAEFMSKQLENVGFDIDIKLHPADMMMQLASKGQLEFFRRSWFADYPDAENFMSCFYSKNQSPPNYTRYKNKQFDALYEQSVAELIPAKRIQIYRAMEEILLKDAIIVPIFYDQSIRLVQKNITGMQQNVLNQLDLKKVKIK